ncbi:MAG: YbhB/YbcL family Raf kinase inhibitor-like protein [Nocardioidaceae bacterium]
MDLARPRAEDPYAKLPPVASFDLTSPDLTDGAPLPQSAVGDGGNTSPELVWANVPEGTQSFAVTCFDPDAPTPSGFWHWFVVDVPANVTSLPSGAGESDDAVPSSAFHLRNDVGHASYDGAAPPEGDAPHRYYYVVHAVSDETLGVDETTSPAVASFQLASMTLGRAILVGTHRA